MKNYLIGLLISLIIHSAVIGTGVYFTGKMRTPKALSDIVYNEINIDTLSTYTDEKVNTATPVVEEKQKPVPPKAVKKKKVPKPKKTPVNKKNNDKLPTEKVKEPVETVKQEEQIKPDQETLEVADADIQNNDTTSHAPQTETEQENEEQKHEDIIDKNKSNNYGAGSNKPRRGGTQTNALINSFLKTIEKEKNYPSYARKAGIEGTVRIIVTFNKNGHIDSIALQEGDYHPILAEATLKTMKNVEARWRPPSRGAGKQQTVIIPVQYNLRPSIYN